MGRRKGSKNKPKIPIEQIEKFVAQGVKAQQEVNQIISKSQEKRLLVLRETRTDEVVEEKPVPLPKIQVGDWVEVVEKQSVNCYVKGRVTEFLPGDMALIACFTKKLYEPIQNIRTYKHI